MLGWRIPRAAALVAATAGLLAACGRAPDAAEPTPALAPPPPPRVASNILRADYAGSAACADCHADLAAAWAGSPMHLMTRDAATARVEAPFDGATFRVHDDTVTMETAGGHRFVRLSSTSAGERRYRVTKIIGGRYREDFAGVEVTHARDPFTAGGRERVMPMSFVYSTRSWRYKGYSVMTPERPGMRPGAAWAQKCIGCHNTLPYLALLFDDLLGPGAPSYQGTMSDRLLPPARTWPVEIADAEALRTALVDELTFLRGAPPEAAGGPLPALLAEAITTARRHLDGDRVVELGIGCESCHNGARAHVDDPDVLPSFEVRSAALRIGPRPGARAPTEAERINRVCARCHTVLFSAYPHTWEGGRRDQPTPGGSTTNSGEARDFLLGGCASELACTACHDPHARDRDDRLAALAGAGGDALCTSCHPALADAAAAAAHTHHPADSAGARCLNCHMPRKNMGLGYELVRYHRIGSPTERARVEGDRPLECALCHPDRSVAELVTTMEAWWPVRFDRVALRRLYGDDLGVNALAATVARGKAHEQAAAIGALGEHRVRAAVPALVPHLAHEYPLVRYYAHHALEQIVGRPVPLDVGLPAAEIRAAAERWLALDAAP